MIILHFLSSKGVPNWHDQFCVRTHVWSNGLNFWIRTVNCVKVSIIKLINDQERRSKKLPKSYSRLFKSFYANAIIITMIMHEYNTCYMYIVIIWKEVTCNTAPQELQDDNPMVVATLGQRISVPSVSVINPASDYCQSKRLVSVALKLLLVRNFCWNHNLCHPGQGIAVWQGLFLVFKS